MIRTLVTALLLATPMAAAAQCPHDYDQAMSCADGKVWDKNSKTCTSATG
ncbi:hypothetical protein [Thalassovita sp.]|nr:hypothetical protein [Thalassovita sp.]MDF1801534.1 hypothetical protein [Thalassovita sp.]